jgi:hypothetical protein
MVTPKSLSVAILALFSLSTIALAQDSNPIGGTGKAPKRTTAQSGKSVPPQAPTQRSQRPTTPKTQPRPTASAEDLTKIVADIQKRQAEAYPVASEAIEFAITDPELSETDTLAASDVSDQIPEELRGLFQGLRATKDFSGQILPKSDNKLPARVYIGFPFETTDGVLEKAADAKLKWKRKPKTDPSEALRKYDGNLIVASKESNYFTLLQGKIVTDENGESVFSGTLQLGVLAGSGKWTMYNSKIEGGVTFGGTTTPTLTTDKTKKPEEKKTTPAPQKETQKTQQQTVSTAATGAAHDVTSQTQQQGAAASPKAPVKRAGCAVGAESSLWAVLFAVPFFRRKRRS